MKSPFTLDHAAQANALPFVPQQPEKYVRGDSMLSGASVTTNSPTPNFCSETTSTSNDSTSPTVTATYSSLQEIGLRSPKITTYYYYNKDGNLQLASTHDPVTHSYPEHPGLRYYLQHGDTVGAYLAQRMMIFPTCTVSDTYSYGSRGSQAAYEQQPDAYHATKSAELRHENDEQYDSYDPFQNGYPKEDSTARRADFARHTNSRCTHPDPEDVRHLHTLLDLLPHIDPGRRFNGLSGASVDIVEQDTGKVFAHHVPKKMLVLFLGRRNILRFIKTADRSKSSPKIQNMTLPRGIASASAIKILIAWMTRACRPEHDGLIRQFNVPRNTFAACSLAQTLTLFGLHKDALRVDSFIAHNNFKRTIFADELAALWNCMGENNRYVYAAIKAVSSRLRAYEADASEKHKSQEEIVQLLDEYPALEARVRDLDVNEGYRPTFSTEWCKNFPEGHTRAKMHDRKTQASGFDEISQNRGQDTRDESDWQPYGEVSQLGTGL
jgi:hypothetical protein